MAAFNSDYLRRVMGFKMQQTRFMTDVKKKWSAKSERNLNFTSSLHKTPHKANDLNKTEPKTNKPAKYAAAGSISDAGAF